MSFKVAVVDASKGGIEKAVHRAIDSIENFHSIGDENSTLVIKPNLCNHTKSCMSGVTTDPKVVEAIITYLREKKYNGKIVIAHGKDTAPAFQAFEQLGYSELAERYEDVILVDLSNDSTYKLVLPNGKKLRTFEIPNTLLFMDYFINVAKLKRHVSERYTGIWKNQYGCIPSKQARLKLHPFLKEVLFDINSILKPDLSVIDATIALEGPGPMEGTPRRLNKIICSRNPLSADIVGITMMGEKPKRVPHIKYALKNGRRDAEDIQIVGDFINQKDIASRKFDFISEKEYTLYRVNYRLKRIAAYIENMGDLLSATSFALRSIGGSAIIGGEVLSTRKLLKEAWDMMFKFEASEKLIG